MGRWRNNSSDKKESAKYDKSVPPIKDLTELKEPVGRLTVRKWLGRRSDNGQSYYLCSCSCGTELAVLGKNLSRGMSQSCGCMRAEMLSQRRWKGHGGLSGSYWYAIKKDAAKRGHTFEISIEYAWAMFQRQGGRCSLSGLELTTNGKYGRGTASLDRLDSLIGYAEGNVHWVHRDINLMKNTLSLDRFLELCFLVSNYEG